MIDPVLDFDYASGRTSTTMAEKIVAFIKEQQLSARWILETHAHADHLSFSEYSNVCLLWLSSQGHHEHAYYTTVAEQKQRNIHVGGGTDDSGTVFLKVPINLL